MSTRQDLSVPSSGALACQQCGRALPAADAVCAPCNAELAAPPADGLITGKYSCPSCARKFPKPAFALEPANAKWYVPQVQKLVCPHCNIQLLDSRNPPLSPYQVFALFVLATCAPLFVPTAYAQTVRIVLVIALLATYLWRRAWRLPESRRYIRDQV